MIQTICERSKRTTGLYDSHYILSTAAHPAQHLQDDKRENAVEDVRYPASDFRPNADHIQPVVKVTSSDFDLHNARLLLPELSIYQGTEFRTLTSSIRSSILEDDAFPCAYSTEMKDLGLRTRRVVM
jgi:hypothetical protein